MSNAGEWGFNPLEDPSQNPVDIAKQAAFEIAVATGIGHHDIALTVGSGWADVIDSLGKTTEEIPVEEITGFGVSGIPGHLGTIRSVLLPTGKRLLVIAARTHLYEGHGVRRVVHSTRTAAAAGAAVILLTSGVSSIRPAWQPGTAVLIKDHLNLTGVTALEGAQFLDQSAVYSNRLRTLVHSVDASLAEAALAQLPGPQHCTPTEVQMLRNNGAEVVSFSIALEAMAARQSQMEVLGLGWVLQQAAGISAQSHTQRELAFAHEESIPRVSLLLSQILNLI